MANNQKPTFSFGNAGTGTSGTSLFGSTATTSQPSTGSLFGSTSTSQPSSSGGGLFGAASTTSGTAANGGGGASLFGNASSAGGSSAFGSSNGGNPSTAAPANIFGGSGKPAADAFSFGKPASTTASGSGLFGSAPASSQTSQPSNTATSSAPSLFGTPNKQTDSSNQDQTPKSLFGAPQNSGGSSMFSLGGNPATTTPTSKPTTSLFGNSTTPAGLPPASSIGAQSSSNLFSSIGQPPSSASAQAPQTSTAASSIFDTSNKSGGNLFGNPTPNSQGGGLFQNLNKPQTSESGQKTENQNSGLGSAGTPSQSTAPSLFSTASSAPAPSFSFPKPSAPASSASSSSANPPATSSGSTSNLFGALNKPQDPPAQSSASPATTAAPAANLFGALAKPPTPASSAAPNPGANMFAALGKSSAPATTAITSTEQNAEPAKSNAANPKQSSILSGSTMGPAPPAQSRLKNKSMDDIITRWATDLSKYQKEFQKQADKVARWDRLLVDNSEKIQKLYGQTLEAERATTEVERQLSAVEQDQGELESWLQHYENEIDNLIKQQGDGEAATGPDAERQRTYQLAGQLSERLEEMGKDLSSMIEEINDASSSLSRNNKKDDPLSQVVRVLNSHLVQLQNIDQGATALTQQVQAYQKNARTMRPGSSNGSLMGSANNHAADGFWRSYMGRR